MTMQDPLVSVVTPVYNGEKYLAVCIESVLAQTYQNWDYVIVNNCSTDNTLEIAQHHAGKDKRIKVVSNHQFVGVIENHNIAFRLISEESKYCKVVSADDWLYPECLSKMVRLAEAHPSVGIVGSYQLTSTNIVKWKGLPPNVETISGREVCRLGILNMLDVFGGTTSSLYRSDLIRKNIPFFPHLRPYADTSAVYKYLQYCDYGFVHEILSTERSHHESVGARIKQLGMGEFRDLDKTLQYGPIYFGENEFTMLKKEALTTYWRHLGGYLLNLAGLEFWRFHASGLRELGYPFPWRKVLKGAIDEIIDEMHNPKVALHKLFTVVKNKFQIKSTIW
ncbi:MAG: hypothetical protein NTNFB02_01960 [Nitrospira sp.]